MLKIDKLEDIRGNNVVIYSIKSLIEKGNYPQFSIMSGHMGVGKSTAARIVAQMIDETDMPIQTVNFGLDVNMQCVEDTVFKLNPSSKKVFIFEEMHGLNKSQQTALLTMLDKQPSNVYIIGTTTELFHVLSTIRSRATVWNFKLLGEKQLSQLLDDYLVQSDATLTSTAKQALLKSCYGVPRDLLKSADLAIAGSFTADQLSELLGQMSDDLIFTLLCSLKSTSIDFATNMAVLVEDSGSDKLRQMRDFFTRYLLERKGIEGATLNREKIVTLDSLFSIEDINKIGRVLVKATPSTLALELSLLNMELSNTNKAQVVGQQIDRLSKQQASSVPVDSRNDLVARKNNARVTSSDLRLLQLD